jgi:hypothetical protein
MDGIEFTSDGMHRAVLPTCRMQVIGQSESKLVLKWSAISHLPHAYVATQTIAASLPASP